MAKKSPSTPALKELSATKAEFTVHEYQHNTETGGWGQEAATALNIEAKRVFKTLMISLDDSLCVAVVPVSGNLDLKAAARALGGKKAELADPHAAQRATGYVLGGISPLGQKKRHMTVIDESVFDFDTVLVSAGKRGMDIELRPADLVKLTDGRVALIRSQ